jgi:hypothetical protein
MAPKSALSAALGGAPVEPAARPISTTKKPFIDPAAFPCIAYAAEMDGEVLDSLSPSEPTEDAFVVEPFELVGSAPTGSGLMVCIEAHASKRVLTHSLFTISYHRLITSSILGGGEEGKKLCLHFQSSTPP